MSHVPLLPDPPDDAALPEAEAVAILAAVLDATDMGFGVWDRQLRFRLVNPALADINGVPVEDHIGRTVHEILGELGADVAAIFEEIIATGRPARDVEVVGETRRSPGVRRRWHASYYPVAGRDGSVARIAGTVVEVTDIVAARDAERRATRAAHSAAALVDAVFAEAPVGLAVWSPDLRFQRVNAAFAAFTGRPVDDHVGRTLDEVLGEHAGRVRPHVAQVLATRSPLLELRTSVDAPAGRAHYDVSYFPVVGPDGELTAVGAMARDVTERHHAERERTRLLAEAVAARARAEAEQARAESAQRAAEAARMRTAFLARAGARMSASMDFAKTLEEVVASAVPEIADWCMITLVEPDGRLGTLAVAHVDPDRRRFARELAERYPPRRTSIAGPGRVIATGRTERIPEIPEGGIDLIARDEEHGRMLRALGLRSSLVVPLRTAGTVLGALSLAYAESGRSYGEDDEALARALAARAALHIQNARLYTELSHIAITLQRSLLPRELPDVPGLELATRYKPVGEHNDVGGDFYDVFPSEPGVWTALIGDVSGKGAEAAAITALARYTLRAAAMRESDPAANLRLLNETMLADAETTRFCTIVYARVCPGPDGALVTLGNGGHMPPIIIRADRRVEQIELPGSLVGVLAAPEFATTEVRLGPGDLMLLYTDGVTDLRTRGPQSGERQLAETVQSLAGRPTEEILDAIQQMAVEAQDGRPRDDIALLALRARPGTDR